MRFVHEAVLEDSTLVISDLHIGYEESFTKKGILLPKLQFKETLTRLNDLIKQTKPKTIVINGDLKHEFGTISTQEWSETLKVIDLLKENAKLILLRGNHDTILGPIALKKGIEIKDYHMVGQTYICHGHKIPTDKDFKRSKTIIIGHEHPAITLSEGIKQETYKCFLKTKYKDKVLIVLPSFSQISEGTDITRQEFLSPFLKNLKKVQVIITNNKELYDFGEYSF